MNLKNSHTADLADQIIGAAQALDKLARNLRQDAKNIRAHGIYSSADFDAVANMRFHKSHDVKSGASLALQELGTLPAGGWLSEHRPGE